MNKKSILIKIATLILAAAMVMPSAVFALDETGTDGIIEDAAASEFSDEEPASEEIAVEEQEMQDKEGESDDDPVIQQEEGESDDDPIIQEEESESDDGPAVRLLKNVTINENPSGTVKIKWSSDSEAKYYEVTSRELNTTVRTENCSQIFRGLNNGTRYVFEISAFDEDDRLIAQGTASITTNAFSITFKDSDFRTLRNSTISGRIRSGNLTGMINEKNDGYAVVQGGCTDGTYAYYLMVSSTTQHGRVLKVRLSDNKVMARSEVLNIWHGNGMAYDSKRNKLVVIARESRKQEITLIDANTLKITRQENVKYNNYADAGSDSFNKTHQAQGLAAIAYVEKYDCYIVLQRIYHNLIIFDPDSFEAIGMVRTDIRSAYPGTHQAMDADEKYVYLLLSPYQNDEKAQPYNLILVLDWNSENLLPVVNASKSKDPKYVEKPWCGNNNQSGRQDAVIRLNTPHEAENIFHTTDASGREHFYLAEYYGHYVYNSKTKKKTYTRDNFTYDLGVI